MEGEPDLRGLQQIGIRGYPPSPYVLVIHNYGPSAVTIRGVLTRAHMYEEQIKLKRIASNPH